MLFNLEKYFKIPAALYDAAGVDFTEFAVLVEELAKVTPEDLEEVANKLPAKKWHVYK